MKGNLTKLREEQMKSPLDDVDKLLKKQLEKEKEAKEEKERNQNLMKEISTKKKKKENDVEIISPNDIKEIKNNLNSNKKDNNNNNNKKDNINNEVFEKNKNILKNISISNENPKKENVNDFKRNSNMIGLDFFTGDFEGGKNKNNNNNNNDENKNDNPFISKINDNNNIENIKNAQNPHNQEVLNRLMNKIVPENKTKNDNKELEDLLDLFNGDTPNSDNNFNKDKENNIGKPNNNNNFNNNINNSNNNNIFSEINNNFIKPNSYKNNDFKPQNIEDQKKMNSTPFDFDDDDDDIL